MERTKIIEHAPKIVVAIVAVLLLGWMFFGFGGVQVGPQTSIEVGVTSLSPAGIAGGYAIPASCPSYEHTPGQCAPPPPNFFGENNQTSESGGAITINSGGSATLDWDASPTATSCDGLNFSTGGATAGSVVVSPTSDTTYTVVCNYDPNTYSPSTLQSSVGVTVLNPALSISASPVSVRSGRESIITWSATEVDSCLVAGPNGFSQTGLSGSAPTGPLTQQSTYIIVCENEGGSESASAVVTIIPSFEEF